MKATLNKYYDAKAAADYLNLTYESFLTYANESGKLAYKLMLGVRIYTQGELDRFKKEDMR